MSNPEFSAGRLVELETLVMHLQRDVEQLSSAVLGQQAEINALRKLIDRLEARLDTAQAGPERRSPLEERPPHY